MHGIPRPERNTLVRRLALAKLRELRLAGLSYREIGRRFGAAPGAGQVGASGFEFRLSPERLLTAERAVLEVVRTSDAALFLRALDSVEAGFAFFDCTATVLHANRWLSERFDAAPAGAPLLAEVQQFAASLCGLIHLRDLADDRITRLALRELPTREAPFRMTGSYVGMDLFGSRPTLLVSLERAVLDPLSDDALRGRFGLSKKEACIVRLLIEGRTNREMARALFLSTHTVRHHTMHIFQKLAVHSRTEVAAMVLRG
ncbi:MAG: response regulator transcription factor [Longimicrobiaceae bacterium]